MILCRMKTQVLFVMILVTYISLFFFGLMKIFGQHILNESTVTSDTISSATSSMGMQHDDDDVVVEVVKVVKVGDDCISDEGIASSTKNTNTWNDNIRIQTPIHRQLEFLHVPKNGGSAITDSAIQSNLVSCTNIQY